RRDDGHVDAVALASLPVLDDALARHCETVFQGCPGVTLARASVRECQPRRDLPPPVHVGDWLHAAALDEPAADYHFAQRSVAVEVRAPRDAYSDGGPLTV